MKDIITNSLSQHIEQHPERNPDALRAAVEGPVEMCGFGKTRKVQQAQLA